MKTFLLKVICVFSIPNVLLEISKESIYLRVTYSLLILRKSWSRIGQRIESKLPFYRIFPSNIIVTNRVFNNIFKGNTDWLHRMLVSR